MHPALYFALIFLKNAILIIAIYYFCRRQKDGKEAIGNLMIAEDDGERYVFLQVNRADLDAVKNKEFVKLKVVVVKSQK